MPNPQPKRPRGRPPGTTKPKTEKTINVNTCLRPELAEKLKLLGGQEWIRQQIQKARL